MKAWLGILTAAVVLLTAGLVVGLVTLNADVQKLDAQLSDMLFNTRKAWAGGEERFWQIAYLVRALCCRVRASTCSSRAPG